MLASYRLLAATMLALSAVSLLSGCGSTTSGGGSTPEETFKSAQAAAEKEDWKGIMSHMTVESQETMAGMMAFGGAMAQMFAGLGGPEGEADAKKVKAVFDKHGLDEETLKKLEPDPTSPDMFAGMKKMAEPIKDRGQFVADMMTALKGTKGFKDKNPIQKNAALKDVKIDGDTAKATIEATIDGKTSSSPIAFKKVDGKWLMDLTETMKSGMDKGGPGPDAGLPPGGLDAPGGIDAPGGLGAPGPDAGLPPGGLDAPK